MEGTVDGTAVLWAGYSSGGDMCPLGLVWARPTAMVRGGAVGETRTMCHLRGGGCSRKATSPGRSQPPAIGVKGTTARLGQALGSRLGASS